jgi:hypothetical protein
MSAGATPTNAIAFNWIDAIRRKTVKNMTHLEYIQKYSQVRQNVDQLVLILTGLRFRYKEYFLIRIHGALYEPFVGPHYVQIGDDAPFWVHSLTAFRREFFGLTDKLSFERSVFVGLSDGEVIRLKIARHYLFMAHDIALAPGLRLRIMKTPHDSFHVSDKDILKHKSELTEKKRKAVETNQAVRTRIRNHLVGSVQQLFCSYMRDTQIAHDKAYMWFQTDMQHAMSQCNYLYSSFARVRPQRDEHDYVPDEGERPALATATQHLSTALMSSSSRVDHNISDMMRDMRQRERAGQPMPAEGAMQLAMMPVAQDAAVQPLASVASAGASPLITGLLPLDIGGRPYDIADLLYAGIEEDVQDNVDDESDGTNLL